VDSAFAFDVTQFAANTGWALSPDGSRLAIGLNTGAGDDVWIKRLPRGPASRITYDPAPEFRPRWTPDGRSVIFVASRSQNGVYIRRADGTGTDSLLAAVAGVQEAALSPDGVWLLMRIGGSAGAGGRDIVGLRLGVDSVPVPVLATRFDEEAIALSPDGHWLAYHSDETGTSEVFIRPFPGTDRGRWQVSSGGGVAPLWSRDGRELFFLSAAGDMMAARVTAGPTLAVGEPRLLFRVPVELRQVEADYYTPWDVARDGRFIMVRALDMQNRVAGTLVVVENFPEEIRARMRQ
jgi:Tol biopolymer transport system component